MRDTYVIREDELDAIARDVIEGIPQDEFGRIVTGLGLLGDLASEIKSATDILGKQEVDRLLAFGKTHNYNEAGVIRLLQETARMSIPLPTSITQSPEVLRGISVLGKQEVDRLLKFGQTWKYLDADIIQLVVAATNKVSPPPSVPPPQATTTYPILPPPSAPPPSAPFPFNWTPIVYRPAVQPPPPPPPPPSYPSGGGYFPPEQPISVRPSGAGTGAASGGGTGTSEKKTGLFAAGLFSNPLMLLAVGAAIAFAAKDALKRKGSSGRRKRR